ncbi:MAG TPA: BrnA antitoxin family protein [Leptospiraceae bacterium]|nr:BrnA antitoxin family protein [Leptospiraceae bacterium]HRG74753.1 BrnA antitoxin family protein [Leptospiraceae bacterium]
MRKEYDFTNSKKNPYTSKLKKQITIRIDENTIKYFKEVAGDTGIPYQNLINLYLYECATSKKKLELKWS